MGFSYLDLAGFRSRTIMPSPDVDEVELVEPGFITRALEARSAWINAQLDRRYVTPFAAPYPETVLDWLTRLVTPLVYNKRGINRSDSQFEEIKEQAKTVGEELADAANSATGRFDLPLRSDTEVSAVARGGPLVYAEASPYTFADVQAEIVRGGGG